MNKKTINDTFEQAAEDTDDSLYGEPVPLQRSLAPPEPFPIDALGDTLAPCVRAIMNAIQAPDGICGQSILAAAALAVQGYANAVIDGREIPLSEFFITIGTSGERKTAVDNVALHIIRAHQNKLRLAHEKIFLRWQTNMEAYEAEKRHQLKKAKSYEERKNASAAIGEPPLRPVDPIILMDEPTYEGLIKLLTTGQPSVGLFSDEGGRFIGGHGMNNDNILKTAAGMSGLWDGKPTTRIRVGDTNVLLYGKRVSFHLMVQPNVAQMMLSNPILTGQGLTSRCLISYPLSTAGGRLYKEIDISVTDEFKKYLDAMNKIVLTPLPLAEGKQNELCPRKIPLSSGAKSAFIEFHDEVECELGDSGRFSTIRGFANKAPEHALRLAGILSLFNDINVVEISTYNMESGIILAKYYLNEALRLFNASMSDPELTQAEMVLSWLHSQNKKEVSLIEIYQYGPNSIRDPKAARKTMFILQEHGWVIPLEKGAMFDGSLRKEAWKVR